jgi:hypothetical protein
MRGAGSVHYSAILYAYSPHDVSTCFWDNNILLCDFRLLPRCEILLSGILRSIDRQLLTDVSDNPSVPSLTIKQTVQAGLLAWLLTQKRSISSSLFFSAVCYAPYSFPELSINTEFLSRILNVYVVGSVKFRNRKYWVRFLWSVVTPRKWCF